MQVAKRVFDTPLNCRCSCLPRWSPCQLQRLESIAVWQTIPSSVVPTSKDIISPHSSPTANCDRCCSVSGLETSERGGRLEWRVNRVPITLSCVEVTTNRTYDQDQTPQTSQNGSLACIGKQLCEKPGKQYGLDESAKNDEECQRQASS